MIFIGYAKNHVRDCYCIYNHNTRYVKEMRGITWLHCMYYSKPEARGEVVVYLQVSLHFKSEEAEGREGVMLNASETKVEFKDDEKECCTVCTRSGRVVKPPLLYMKE